MGVRRYQDLECWRLANELKNQVYALVRNSPARGGADFRGQIIDAACSGPRNIAEGFGRYRHTEFAEFLGVAKGSIAETHNHLGDGFDRKYWSAGDRDRAQKLAEQAAGATAGLIRYLRRTREPAEH